MSKMIRVFIAALFAIGALSLTACGGPSCETIPTCDPECDITMGEFCIDGTCRAPMACDPACGDGQFCNDGTCEDLPRECDPACGSGEFCDDGACRAIPVCDPPCGANEVCVD